MTWSPAGEGGRCYHLVLVGGREVLSLGPEGVEGGVVTRSRGGEGGVVTRSWGGRREVL